MLAVMLFVSGRLSVAPLAAAEDLPRAQASIVLPGELAVSRTSPCDCSYFALGKVPDVTMLARVIVHLTE